MLYLPEAQSAHDCGHGGLIAELKWPMGQLVHEVPSDDCPATHVTVGLDVGELEGEGVVLGAAVGSRDGAHVNADGSVSQQGVPRELASAMLKPMLTCDESAETSWGTSPQS